jgi:uncharacterized membrane protein YfcA
MSGQYRSIEWSQFTAASVSASAGAYFGSKLLNKVTIRTVQLTISALPVVVSPGLISGML